MSSHAFYKCYTTSSRKLQLSLRPCFVRSPDSPRQPEPRLLRPRQRRSASGDPGVLRYVMPLAIVLDAVGSSQCTYQYESVPGTATLEKARDLTPHK